MNKHTINVLDDGGQAVPVEYYLASEVEALYPASLTLIDELKKRDARIAELEKALREAMEWNWFDDDMNEGVRAQCERALSQTPAL